MSTEELELGKELEKPNEDLEFPVSSDAGKVNLEIVVPKEGVFNYISGFDNKSFHLKGELRRRVYDICQTLSPEDLTQGSVYQIAHLVYDIMRTQHEISGIEEEIGEYQVTLNQKAEDLVADNAMLETIVRTQPQIEGEVEEEVVEKKKMPLRKKILAATLIPIVLGAGSLAYLNRGKIMSGPAPVNIESVVAEKYEQYAEAIALAEEQRRPARALLVGGADGANDDPPIDTDPEGHYQVAQWLTAGWLLEMGLTNNEIEFRSHNPGILVKDGEAYQDLVKSLMKGKKAYQDFVNRNDTNLVRVMNLALENLIIDGPSNYSSVVDGLKDLAGERAAFIWLFGVEKTNFVLPGGNLTASRFKEIIEQIGGLESSISANVGGNASSYSELLDLENTLKINTESRWGGSTIVENSKLVEDLISSYLENPELPILGILNKFLSMDPKMYAGSFVDKKGVKYRLGSSPENLIFFKRSRYSNFPVSNPIFLEDGTPLSQSIASVDKNGLVYSKSGGEFVVSIDPKTGLPRRLNGMHSSFGDYLAGK